MKKIMSITILFSSVIMLSCLVTASDCQCNSFDNGISINSFLVNHGTSVFYSDSMEAFSWNNAAGDKTFFLIDPSGRGSVSLKDSQLFSEVATGTSPFVVASTTRVDNLNADLLDGYHVSELLARISALESKLKSVESLQITCDSADLNKDGHVNLIDMAVANAFTQKIKSFNGCM